MEMKQIIEQLEGQLKKERLEAEELEQKVSQWMAMLENAEEALKVKRDNITSLEMMIEAGKEGHFGLTEKKTEPVVVTTEEVKPVKTDEKPAKKEKKKAVKQPEFRHKDAFVVKINEYDNVLDRWRTQRAAAKSLNLSQSSVCLIMKQDKQVQIRSRGYALLWEY